MWGAGEVFGEPGVEFAMANKFIKNLNALSSSDKPIKIFMKTCGGYWEEGIAIYDAIALCPCEITIINYTHARSMSSLILQAANHRVMMPNSTFMFHEGTMDFSGTSKQFMTEAEQWKLASKTMLDIYVESMKGKGRMKEKTDKELRSWLTKQMNLKEEVYLDAQEAVALGFADEVRVYE